MQYFLVKVLKLVSPIFISIFIICIPFEILLRNIPNNYSFKNNYLDKNSNDVEVIILGSSHAYFGINPLYITLKSFNAAYLSQSLNYDFEILKKYQQNFKKLKYIVIPIDYFSLYSTLEILDGGRIKNYVLYYGIKRNYLSNSTNLEVLGSYSLFLSNLKSFYLNNISLEVLGNPSSNLSRLQNFYLNKIDDISSTELGFVNLIYKETPNLDSSGIIAAKRHTIKDDQYYQYNINILKGIINFSNTNNIKLILYTSPAYKTYLNNLNLKQLNQTTKFVTNLSQSFNNVFYYNLISDTSFKLGDFSDADHLNAKGAKKLSSKIDGIIKSLILPL